MSDFLRAVQQQRDQRVERERTAASAEQARRDEELSVRQANFEASAEVGPTAASELLRLGAASVNVVFRHRPRLWMDGLFTDWAFVLPSKYQCWYLGSFDDGETTDLEGAFAISRRHVALLADGTFATARHEPTYSFGSSTRLGNATGLLVSAPGTRDAVLPFRTEMKVPMLNYVKQRRRSSARQPEDSYRIDWGFESLTDAFTGSPGVDTRQSVVQSVISLVASV